MRPVARWGGALGVLACAGAPPAPEPALQPAIERGGMQNRAGWAWRWAPGAVARADDGDDGGDDGGDGTGGEGLLSARRERPLTQPAESFLPDEVLALAPDAAALRRVRALGFTVIERVRLSALKLTVVRLRLPPGLDAQTARIVLAEPGPGVFDLHHRYRLAAAEDAACAAGNCALPALLGWPQDPAACGRDQRIGVVDTAVVTTHPALAGATIRTQSFVAEEETLAQEDHGTAIAALLVGQPGTEHPGLVPRATLLAAAPFHVDAEGGTTADTVGLVRSLDWLVQEGAKVVGMSLAGQDNRILQAAVDRAQAQGVVVVAAAGNGGRNAPPAYPAAFQPVVAVTAISAQERIYWRANRGDYVDYALPGVQVWTATRAGAGRARSGTSYAVPFMVALASQSLAQRIIPPKELLAGALPQLRDLGDAGRDPVFGFGVPRLGGTCR